MTCFHWAFCFTRFVLASPRAKKRMYLDLMFMQGKVKQNGKDRRQFSGLLARFGIAEVILI